MKSLELSIVVQMCLAFGMSGLFWPEKLLPLFELLMFPWAASSRTVRTNSLAVVGLALLLLARLLAGVLWS